MPTFLKPIEKDVAEELARLLADFDVSESEDDHVARAADAAVRGFRRRYHELIAEEKASSKAD
ncbi:hypothetical protein [Parvularcula dongshanensis]|uniref:Uncharacterized protein n=1 Tax=Parvularcula dongshanensis TaxID=1173995 RepID=A0A840I0X2_9PROT|nr:hypothetical protein [Parvularcula dongshanensis]MBB4657852.1 hypothetical protein [Parvularcula dongshanensis]